MTTMWGALRSPKLSERMFVKDRRLLATMFGKSVRELVEAWRAVYPEDFAGVVGDTSLSDIERNAGQMITFPAERSSP